MGRPQAHFLACAFSLATRAWNNATRSWEQLSSADYSAAVRKAVRIAKKQATIELLNMPIAAPEAN